MAEEWYEKSKEGVIVRLKVQPNAARTEIMGIEPGAPVRLRVRLSAPPVDGKANKEVLAFLSRELGIGKSSLAILRGEKSSQKDVLCRGVTEEKAAALLPGGTDRR
eukprot:gene1941-2119_t